MIRRLFLGAGCCLALALSGCAVGGGSEPSASGGGSDLAPTFAPDHGKHHAKGHRDAAPAARGTHAAAPHASRSPSDPHGATGPTAPASTAPAAGTPAAPSAPTATATDRTGDVSGAGAPAYVDLTGATVSRAGTGYRARVDVDAPPPARLGDGKNLNVACFVDTDGDGQVDYEMWANLSESGWSTSYRYPEGARFGDSSGVTVTVSGSSVTLAFPGSHVGGASSFRWAAGAEYGTVEQVASGTTSRDLAPDTGAARFPEG